MPCHAMLSAVWLLDAVNGDGGVQLVIVSLPVPEWHPCEAVLRNERFEPIHHIGLKANGGQGENDLLVWDFRIQPLLDICPCGASCWVGWWNGIWTRGHRTPMNHDAKVVEVILVGYCILVLTHQAGRLTLGAWAWALDRRKQSIRAWETIFDTSFQVKIQVVGFQWWHPGCNRLGCGKVPCHSITAQRDVVHCGPSSIRGCLRLGGHWRVKGSSVLLPILGNIWTKCEPTQTTVDLSGLQVQKLELILVVDVVGITMMDYRNRSPIS